MTNYVAKELHPTLISVFAKIVIQEDERIISERKATLVGASSSKRTRRGENDVLYTGRSFRINNLGT